MLGVNVPMKIRYMCVPKFFEQLFVQLIKNFCVQDKNYNRLILQYFVMLSLFLR